MTEPYVSIGPVGWALTEAPGLPAQLLGVLVALAMHADAEGRNAYPSQEKVAAISRKSERQVRTDLAKLEELGLIRRGDQDRVRFLPLDKRPIVWDLATERERGEVDFRPLARGYSARMATGGKPTSGRGGKPTSERREVHFPDGGKSTAAEVILEQPEKNHVEVIRPFPDGQPGAPLRSDANEGHLWLDDEEPPDEEEPEPWSFTPEPGAMGEESDLVLSGEVLERTDTKAVVVRVEQQPKPGGRTVQDLIESVGGAAIVQVVHGPPPTIDVREPLKGFRTTPHAFVEDDRTKNVCAACDLPKGNKAAHPTQGRAK